MRYLGTEVSHAKDTCQTVDEPTTRKEGGEAARGALAMGLSPIISPTGTHHDDEGAAN